jgi:hypothetical protein
MSAWQLTLMWWCIGVTQGGLITHWVMTRQRKK